MGNTTAESKTKRKIEDWKQKLIDLTRRNRLLYFKRTKSSTLAISQPDAQTVFERLVIKEANWDFWFPPEEVKDTDEGFASSNSSITSEKTKEPQFPFLEEKIRSLSRTA